MLAKTRNSFATWRLGRVVSYNAINPENLGLNPTVAKIAEVLVTLARLDN